MTAKDDQIKTLRREMAEHGKLSQAAAAAGLTPKTARKYLVLSVMPSQIEKKPRGRKPGYKPSPFLPEHERELFEMFRRNRRVKAVGLWRFIVDRYPHLYGDAQRRTVERMLRRWQQTYGVKETVRRRRSKKPAA